MVKINRETRLALLVEICQQNKLTPDKNTFSGFIIKVCVNNLSLTQTAAKEHLKALNISWRADQWKSILGETNITLESTDFEFISGDKPDAEKFVVTTIEQKSEVFKSKTLDVLNNVKPEPVKRVMSSKNIQVDMLPEKQVAQVLYRRALQETSGGVGRLLLFDARDIMDNNKLSMRNLIQLWQRYYPTIDYDQATGNVLLIYWDGKTTFRSIRDTQRIVQPKQPLFKPKDNPEADISDGLDENDSIPEANNDGVMTL